MKEVQAIAVGVDGLTKELIDNNRSNLPNLNYLLKRGRTCSLKSVIPVLSPPAWVSLVTGVNPGKHGIYDFQHFNTRRIISALDIRFETLWHRLTQANLKSIVLNVPVTYPPPNINGIMVSGLLTPSLECKFTTPPELRRRILSQGYRIGIEPQRMFELYANNSYKQTLSLLGAVETNRTDIFRDLLRIENWNFAMIVFQELDKIQHFFFGENRIIKHAYQIYDKLIGRILEICERKGLYLLVFSDHGFQAVKNYVFVNRILEQEKILSVNKDNFWEYGAAFLDKVSNRWKSIIAKAVKATNTTLKSKILSRLTGTKQIDFARSEIVGGFSTGPHIPLTVVSRNREKAKRKIIDLFLEMKDHGRRVVDKIYSKQQIYWGPFTNLAPDLVLALRKGYIGHPSVRDFLPDFAEVEEVPIWMRRYGDHDERAMFIAYHPNETLPSIDKNDKASIFDIAPTVYKIFGLNRGPQLDGNSLL